MGGLVFLRQFGLGDSRVVAGRLQMAVAQQLLDVANVHARLQEMGGASVA